MTSIIIVMAGFGLVLKEPSTS